MALVIGWMRRTSRYFPLGLMFTVIAIAAAVPMIPDLYWDRLATLTNFNSDMTLWRRLGYHIIGLDLLAENPFFGVGPGNFPHLYVDPEYRYVPGRTLEPRMLHNMYLGIAAEMGLVGAVAFLGMIASALIRLGSAFIKSANPGQRALAAALLYGSAAYYLGAVLTPAQSLKYTWVLVGVAVAQVRIMQGSSGLRRGSTDPAHSPDDPPQ
jgi:O-antigen ligase